MNNFLVIFGKQIKDTVKNKTVLIQFLMFPVITLVMEKFVKIDGMPEHFFANLFSAMFVGMAPLTSTAAIVAEEKEKNTLRALLMSNVKPMEYLAGVGAYVFLLCMAGAAVIGLGGGYSGKALARFLLLLALGIIISTVLGGAIGLWSRNQMAATGVTVPVMMVLSFLPMLSMFNETIARVSELTYSGQLNSMINGAAGAGLKTALVLALNAGLALAAFVVTYRKIKTE